jgi:hypothetical protein
MWPTQRFQMSTVARRRASGSRPSRPAAPPQRSRRATRSPGRRSKIERGPWSGTVESTWKSRPDRLGHARRDPSPLRSMGSTACIRGGRALAAVGPVQVPAEIERLVLSVAISTATWGCGRIAAYLTRTWRLRVAPSTVQRVLRRAGLATRRARLTVPRAAGGPDGRAADRAYPRVSLARALRAHAPRRGERTRGVGLPGHLLKVSTLIRPGTV